MAQLIMELANGYKLLCNEGEIFTWGGSVVLLDANNQEAGVWEFDNNAEFAVGSIFVRAKAKQEGRLWFEPVVEQ